MKLLTREVLSERSPENAWEANESHLQMEIIWWRASFNEWLR